MTTMNWMAVGAMLMAAPVFAQPQPQLQLPAPSPAAMVKQTVGVTDVTVEYSSPAVNQRKVWGELVPMDKPWRTGANAATKITFTRDATLGGKAVPAGTYSIVTLPGAKSWTVALNKDLTLFSGSGKPYDAKLDVLRAVVTPDAVPHRERMIFVFSNTTDNSTSLDLEWEKVRVSLPITVDTAGHATASIKSTLDSSWRPHATVARYLADTTKDFDSAMKHVDTSIAIQPTWFNHWIKADILAKKGNYAEARKHAQQSWDLGNKDPGFFYKDAVSKALTEWKNKS